LTYLELISKGLEHIFNFQGLENNAKKALSFIENDRGKIIASLVMRMLAEI